MKLSKTYSITALACAIVITGSVPVWAASNATNASAATPNNAIISSKINDTNATIITVPTVGLASGTISQMPVSTQQSQNSTQPVGTTRQITEQPLEVPLSATTQSNYSLTFDANATYETRTATVDNKTVSYRAYENIPYVANPVDVNYQYMNIYIPEDYFQNKKVGKYDAKTAPIFLPNSVGGYMPSTAAIPGKSLEGGTDASTYALFRGYVVAAPATRGRTNKNETTGEYYGKAPAVIVDLQAAVAYLHSNDSRMPGDATKIISNGTSAGGSVSLLLGATGNHSDYRPYLNALGAADASTDIFAVVAFCPITDLDAADMAYEWNYHDVTTYKKSMMGRGMVPLAQTGSGESSATKGQLPTADMGNTPTEQAPMAVATTSTPSMDGNALSTNTSRNNFANMITLSDSDISYSYMLKAQYTDYINDLKLKDSNGKTLTLNSDGTGSFMDYVKSYIIAAANRAASEGTDISSADFLIKDANGTITDVDWKAYNAHVSRSKAPGAFDSRANDAGENNLFGTTKKDYEHFTVNGALFDTTDISATGPAIANHHIIKMMNPMNYLGNTGATNAKYYYIRYGTADSNTSISIPIVVGTKAQNLGYSVNMETPWEIGHRGDYNLEEMFDWMDNSVSDARMNPTVKAIKNKLKKIF